MSTAADVISEELDARQWPLSQLYLYSDLPLDAIRGVLYRDAAVTPAIAAGLARAFGTGAEFWLKLGEAE